MIFLGDFCSLTFRELEALYLCSVCAFHASDGRALQRISKLARSMCCLSFSFRCPNDFVFSAVEGFMVDTCQVLFGRDGKSLVNFINMKILGGKRPVQP